MTSIRRKTLPSLALLAALAAGTPAHADFRKICMIDAIGVSTGVTVHPTGFRSLYELYDEDLAQALMRIRANIQDDGAIIAAKTDRYGFEWIRDAGITDGAIMDYLEATTDPKAREGIIEFMKTRVEKERANQREMWEVKFEKNGERYKGDWARPQYDGPALRAKNFIRFAKYLRKLGGYDEYIRTQLYDHANFANGIKGDLEFLAHHWWESSADLWEERGGFHDKEHGYHFFTRMVQTRALEDGARLAESMGDPLAAKAYWRAAADLRKALEDHWDPKNKINRIIPTLHMEHGQHLDIAVPLGINHAYGDVPVWKALDPRYLSSLDQIELEYKVDQPKPGETPEQYEERKKRYPINLNFKEALAIGRYPGDTYDGERTDSKGGAWPLASLAIAKTSYLQALELAHAKSLIIDPSGLDQAFYQRLLRERAPNGEELAQEIVPGRVIEKGSPLYNEIALALFNKGEAYLRLVKQLGLKTEQINFNTGANQGVEELTWNFASLIGTVKWRKTAMRDLWLAKLIQSRH